MEWDFVDANETIVVPTFREQLASWASECEIPQVHVDKLAINALEKKHLQLTLATSPLPVEPFKTHLLLPLLS